MTRATSSPGEWTGRAERVPPAFVHDLNTCVGCHACALACINENQLAPGGFWRQIVSVNPQRRPGLPTFHLSLACNHCLDAPCLHHCPALAISRDSVTGAVLIDDCSCIGCRYCSWVCPYDAPRFNDARGVMQKCTLCAHRLRDGLQPACVSLCPTGALRMGEYRPGPDPDVTGFPSRGIRPVIRFIPLSGRTPLEPADPDEVAAAETAWRELGGTVAPAPRKISLRSEWTLAAFSFAAIVLVAWMAAWSMGGPAPPSWIVGGGGGAMVLSTLHLGRKGRAWRAMLNWRRSWLSREVITYPVFLALVLVAVVAAPGHPVAGAAAVLAGIACLTSVDRVYVSMARSARARLDDAAATLSAAFLAGIAAGLPWLAIPMGVVRLLGFLSRQSHRTGGRRRWSHPIIAGRIGVGLVLPLVLWLAQGAASWPWTVGCAIVGEAWDRADFYDALDVIAPGGVRS